MSVLRAPGRPRLSVPGAAGSRGVAAIAPRLRVPRPAMPKAGPRRDDRLRLVEPVAPTEPSHWTTISESTPLRSVRPFRQSFLAPVSSSTARHSPHSAPAQVGNEVRVTALRAVDGHAVGSLVAASAVPAHAPEVASPLDQPLPKPPIAPQKAAAIQTPKAISATSAVPGRSPAASLPLRLAGTAPLPLRPVATAP